MATTLQEAEERLSQLTQHPPQNLPQLFQSMSQMISLLRYHHNLLLSQQRLLAVHQDRLTAETRSSRPDTSRQEAQPISWDTSLVTSFRVREEPDGARILEVDLSPALNSSQELGPLFRDLLAASWNRVPLTTSEQPSRSGSGPSEWKLQEQQPDGPTAGGPDKEIL